MMRVADSGPGMDADTFEKAMQRGYSTKWGHPIITASAWRWSARWSSVTAAR